MIYKCCPPHVATDDQSLVSLLLLTPPVLCVYENVPVNTFRMQFCVLCPQVRHRTIDQTRLVASAFVLRRVLGDGGQLVRHGGNQGKPQPSAVRLGCLLLSLG